MVILTIILESFWVQHDILSRQIVRQILYGCPNSGIQLEGEMGHYISIVFGPKKIHVEKSMSDKK